MLIEKFDYIKHKSGEMVNQFQTKNQSKMVQYAKIEEIPQVLTDEKMAELKASINRTLAASAESKEHAQAVGVECDQR